MHCVIHPSKLIDSCYKDHLKILVCWLYGWNLHAIVHAKVHPLASQTQHNQCQAWLFTSCKGRCKQPREDTSRSHSYVWTKEHRPYLSFSKSIKINTDRNVSYSQHNIKRNINAGKMVSTLLGVLGLLCIEWPLLFDEETMCIWCVWHPWSRSWLWIVV